MIPIAREKMKSVKGFGHLLSPSRKTDGWRRAGMVPVCVWGGGGCGAANSRPVSLACICCRALEHIIVSGVGKHLSLGGILAGCQRGFRGRGSCEARLVRFFHDVVGGLGQARSRGRGRTDVVVVDFAGGLWQGAT